MRVTVAICTYNRARLLDQTLTQFKRLEIPPGIDWELLVVNNRCTDHTDEIIDRYRLALPIRRLYQGIPGKSHAANLAVKESRGELILWTDDDVLVEPRWLTAYVEAAKSYPEAVFFAGEVTPWFESEPPVWIRRNMEHIATVFAQRILGFDSDMPISATGHLPIGANMAMRKKCLDACAFDVRVGPMGDVKLSGEETELIKELFRRGYSGIWVKNARVRHFVFTERLNGNHVWNVLRWNAQSYVRLGLEAELNKCPKLFGAPRWVVRKYVEQRLLCLLYSPFKGRRWITSFINAASCRGLLDGYREVQAQCP